MTVEEKRQQARERSKRWRERNPDAEKKRDKTSRKISRDKWKAKNPTYHRQWHLKSKFGLSESDYNRLADSQGFMCAICRKGEGEENGNRLLAIDHCHETGLLRGLLCDSCNRGLGLLGDTLSRLQDALHYLKSRM